MKPNKTPVLNFKKAILLLIGVIVAAAAGGQSIDNYTAFKDYTNSKIVSDAYMKASSFNASESERKFAIVEYFDRNKDGVDDSTIVVRLITSVRYIKDGSVTYQVSPADSAILYIPQDPSRPLKGTMTWKYKDQIYDTTFTETARIDDPSTSSRWTITNMAKATNSTKVLFNKSFAFVSVTSTASSAKTTVTCDRVEFFGERFSGHGNVKIIVDGQQVKTLYQGAQPWITDFERMQPSWYYNFPKATPTSAAQAHTIEFQTDPGNQYIIDMIRTFDYKLTPR